VIAQRRRRNGRFISALALQEKDSVVGNGCIERRCLREIGDQFGDAARVHDGAG
jgi:hypothetical protein